MTISNLRFIDREKASKALPELNPMLATILYGRGIVDLKDAETFLTPDYLNHSHDPYLMKDMEKAVRRILDAIKNQERIVIFTDYDADGIPGAVLWHDFFNKIGYKQFEIYIPHRHDEGFGLNNESIIEFAKNKTDLLITLDCGIGDIEEVEEANKLGIDVIITDHHLPGEILPKAFAVINPKQNDCKYPEKMLCGSGVAYKLILALLKKGNEENVFSVKDGWEKWLLDMVGIATLSDMVPLVGENRVFASFGLRVLRKSPRVGLQKLLGALKVKQESLGEDDVGFSISPRINVASRMADPRRAFELLSTTNLSEADLLVKELDFHNNERKGLVAQIVKDIKKRLREDSDLRESPVLVIGHTHWKPAIVGLASNTIMREAKKPVFVWGREGGEYIKGSCRSDGSINLVELMKLVPEGIFTDFGGHSLSGGFSIAPDRIHEVSVELNRAYSKLFQTKIIDEIVVDAKLEVEDVGKLMWEHISKCGPFGIGNPRPLFLFEKVLVKDIKKFGKALDHVELRLKGETGKEVSAIQFFAADDPKLKNIKKGSKINLLAHMEESLFKYYPEYRLRIVNII